MGKTVMIATCQVPCSKPSSFGRHCTTFAHEAKSNVSITTVSRILNGRETGIPIREETRQRVLSVAAEMGYKPNLLGRGLRGGGRSSLVGVIMRDISDPFHIQILQGIHEAATHRGYRFFLGHVDFRPDAAVACGSIFEESRAHGIIIISDIIDITPLTIPPLTTINQSGVEMGRSAANLLLDMIEQNQDGTEVNDIVISPTLVLRQSTGAPPAH